MRRGRLVELSVARHSGDWRSWHELTAAAPPFLAPEFFALSAPLAAGQPLLAEAWCEGRLAGALPLLRDGHTLRALATPHTPEFDYCGAPEALEEVWCAVRDDRRWRTLVLERVPLASPLASRFVDRVRAEGHKVVVRPGARHRAFALSGFEARLDKHFRQNIARCARKLGGVELERLTSPTRADFDEALALEAMVWKGVAGTSIDSAAHVARLYRALTRLFGPRDTAAVCFLRAAGKRIAMLLTVEDTRQLTALKIGYDPAFAAASPGHLIVWKAASDAEARGLAELSLAGRDDEWKRKWTDTVREHVTVVVYRRSPLGLGEYALREVIRPRLPERLRDLRAPLRHGCQRGDLVGRHGALRRMAGRLSGGLGLRRRFHLRRAPVKRLGEASRFQPGDWVRVRDEAAIATTLDARAALRGLKFVPVQRATCGQLRRVSGQVRRIRGDDGAFRPVSRTVILDGVGCGGEGPDPMGCGRQCPLWYRDEWLEPAPAPHLPPPVASGRRHARVRDLDEIMAGLDLFGRRDGLTFMAEMAAYAARRFAIAAEVPLVYELDRWVAPRRRVFLLQGLACRGEMAGAAGPCDRACPLLWHEDWLTLEP